MVEFTLDKGAATLKCTFKGRMDSHASMEVDKEVGEQLKKTMDEVPSDKLSIVFDLSSVDYIASAFIRVCLQMAKSVNVGRFSVKNTSPSVMKIFVMTGLDKELNVS